MMRTTDFQPGMQVLSRDGVSLGRVREIWTQTDTHGHLPLTRFLLADYGPIKGTTDLMSSPNGYLHVQDGSVFSSDRNDLYIPVSDVHVIESTASATIRHSADVAYHQYYALPEEGRMEEVA